MSSRKSYVTDVPWTEQLSLLGVEVTSRVLPATVTCPLCQHERLTVHRGPHAPGGPHATCASCSFAGTLLELSSRAWGIGVGEAAAKSTDLGVPLLPFDHTDDDIAVVDRAQRDGDRFRALWESSRAATASRIDDVKAALARHHANPTAAAGQRYFDTAGALFGVATFQAVEETFTPRSMRSRARARDSFNPSEARLFAGRGWREVIVLPRFDLPGRLCAFEFVGRRGDYCDRVITTTDRQSGELGLFGLDAALADSPFGRTVLAVDDAMLALRLQARHGTSASVPLPIVSWASLGPRRTGTAWEALAGRKVVFWTRQPTAGFVRQLLAAGDDAYATDAGPQQRDSEEAWCHYIRLPGDAASLLRRLERTAVPALDFLSRWAERASGNALEAFVRGLLRNDIDPVQLANRLSYKARSRIDDIRPHSLRYATKSVTIGTLLVTEARGCWFISNDSRAARGLPPRLVSSAVVRLLERRGPNYLARLIVGDRAVEVELPASTKFDRAVYAAVAAHGLDATFSSARPTSLLQIALAFSGSLAERVSD